MLCMHPSHIRQESLPTGDIQAPWMTKLLPFKSLVRLNTVGGGTLNSHHDATRQPEFIPFQRELSISTDRTSTNVSDTTWAWQSLMSCKWDSKPPIGVMDGCMIRFLFPRIRNIIFVLWFYIIMSTWISLCVICGKNTSITLFTQWEWKWQIKNIVGRTVSMNPLLKYCLRWLWYHRRTCEYVYNRTSWRPGFKYGVKKVFLSLVWGGNGSICVRIIKFLDKIMI